MSSDKRAESADLQDKLEHLSFDATQNLVGFFALLLEIDKRTSPERYRAQ